MNKCQAWVKVTYVKDLVQLLLLKHCVFKVHSYSRSVISGGLFLDLRHDALQVVAGVVKGISRGSYTSTSSHYISVHKFGIIVIIFF